MKKELHKKWEKYSYEDIKRSPVLQKQYSKDFGIKYYENEKLYNPLVQHNQNVFLPGDEAINPRGRLLSSIWNEKDANNFKSEFFGMSPDERAIIIARMCGFEFSDISKNINKSIEETIRIFSIGIKKIISLNRDTCKTCSFRGNYDKCKIWDIKINKSFYCWLYKKQKGI